MCPQVPQVRQLLPEVLLLAPILLKVLQLQME
jgi:hypothetical protein